MTRHEPAVSAEKLVLTVSDARGALDSILPLPNGQALAHLIKGAQLHVLRDAGHELNSLDLGEITSTFIDFLADRTR